MDLLNLIYINIVKCNNLNVICELLYNNSIHLVNLK